MYDVRGKCCCVAGADCGGVSRYKASFTKRDCKSMDEDGGEVLFAITFPDWSLDQFACMLSGLL